MAALTGKAIAPGLANGRAVLLLDSLPVEGSLPSTNKATEILRFQRALQSAKVDLGAFQTHVHQEFGASEAEIFSAHQLLLEDPALSDDILKRLSRETMRAEDATSAAVDEFAQRMIQAQDLYLSERWISEILAIV